LVFATPVVPAPVVPVVPVVPPVVPAIAAFPSALPPRLLDPVPPVPVDPVPSPPVPVPDVPPPVMPVPVDPPLPAATGIGTLSPEKISCSSPLVINSRGCINTSDFTVRPSIVIVPPGVIVTGTVRPVVGSKTGISSGSAVYAATIGRSLENSDCAPP